MPRNQTEDQIKIAKLTGPELEAELAAKQKEVEEIAKREKEAAAERRKQQHKLYEENLDKLIAKLEENEIKIQAAKDDHDKRCTKANKNSAVIAQAEKDLRIKLNELDSAMQLFRRDLALPYYCPAKLEELKVFKAKYLKDEAERPAREKAAEEANKKYQEQFEVQKALELLNLEKAAREKKEAEVKVQAHDKQLDENAHKKYGVWHKTLGAALAIAVYFAISPALPVTAAAYTFLTAAVLFGAALGQIYRNSVIGAGKQYRFKADIDAIKEDSWNPREANEKVAALKAGVDAADWKGYFNSFKNEAACRRPVEFKAGMIQAITQNEEVVKAIRNR